MKRFNLSIIMLGLYLNLFAQGVDFRNITFSQANEIAASENKLIFLDCYTEWCGPCKNMTENVFPLKKAGDYFNKRFVNIKMDMEKGEGIEIAKRYDIKAYPTFLILDSKGDELHRMIGGGELNYFIARTEACINTKKSISELEKEYNIGTISKKDLINYWLLLRCGSSKSYQKAALVGEQLLTQLSKREKTQAQYWMLLRKEGANSSESEAFDFIVNNYTKLKKKYRQGGGELCLLYVQS